MMPRKEPPRRDEEELGELPPLDGAGDDDTEAPAPDLTDDEVAHDGGDPLDDKTGEDDAVEAPEVTGTEGGWLEDADEAETLDVGGDDLLIEQTELLADNDEPGVGDEDYELGDDETATDDDAGEEGPGDDDEELREEDLPRLDADEGGSPDDEDFIDEGFGAEEGAPGVPWGSPRWERAGSPVDAGPMRAVACVARGVLAGGSSLSLVDLEGGSEKAVAVGLDGGDVTRLWARGSAVVATTEDGELFASRDAAASFVAVTSWRALVRPEEGAVGVEVALGEGELWGRTAQGALLWSGDLGGTWKAVDAGGFVAAVGVDEAGELVAIVQAMRGAEVVRGKRGALRHGSLPEGIVPATLSGRIQVAARGGSVAVAIEGEAVRLSFDGGATWARAPGTATATAIGWPKEEGTLLVGLHDEREERTWLARVSSLGEARVVAEVTGANPEIEGGILGLAWDEARGVVWVAGGFGVMALQPPV
jgi:hypothetical protein